MGICSSTINNNGKNNIKNLSPKKSLNIAESNDKNNFRNAKTQYGNFKRVGGSRKEHEKRTVELKNLKTAEIPLQKLQYNLDTYDQQSTETKQLYDVKANIDLNIKDITLMFLIDINIKQKKSRLVFISIKSFINDFIQYLKESKMGNLTISKLEYSDKVRSEIEYYSVNDLDKLFNKLLAKGSYNNECKGPIQALNHLLNNQRCEFEDSKSYFIFHFLNKDSELIDDNDNDKENEDEEITETIREIAKLKYEIIYFDHKNMDFESKLSEHVEFAVAKVNS